MKVKSKDGLPQCYCENKVWGGAGGQGGKGIVRQQGRGYIKRIHFMGGKAQQSKYYIYSLFASRSRLRINPVAKTEKYQDGMGLGIS